ncbi:tetratricopeptide repeat protein [Aquimarina algicola]|uniref:Uncharacterized protein n=1 Tax=Aquimarina algicola TaxID=2589995 RepID=A0A504JE33_9FLAO|nr:hypothetical protein [Aquimarina algicola]TPN86902.1 hypothetical protein FHK87_04685 [Aquimarina algicola]
MKNRVAIILILFGFFSSCNKTKKSEETIKSDKIVKIEFTDKQGNKISKEELASSTGTFNYAIYGIEGVSRSAIVLHEEARQFGQKGDYKNAIQKLELANKEAPKWAYPLYDLAYTYLLQEDYENALKYYRLTDEVAPKGFYTSKTALHTLEREKTGELPKGLYRSYLSLEWINNASEKEEMIKLLVQKIPSFAPAWKEYSSLLEGKERLNAIEKGLEQNPDVETEGMLLINKALAVNESGNLKEASEILTNVIFNTNTTFGNIEMAKFVLNSISEK